jgi:hypothetical protein
MHAKHEPHLSLHDLPQIPAVAVGFVLLFFGRKLFWLFVGALGFLVGAELATQLLPHQPGWTLIIALILGFIGMAVAILVQKIAIAIGGFLAGGYFGVILFRGLDLPSSGFSWLAFLVGGIIGAALMFMLFDWTLIVFSSASGAHLLNQFLVPGSYQSPVVFLALVVIGVLAQGKFLSAPRRREE